MLFDGERGKRIEERDGINMENMDICIRSLFAFINTGITKLNKGNINRV
jgi:hypothetical protein